MQRLHFAPKLLALSLLFFPSFEAARAQTPTTVTLTAKAVDASGAALPGVEIDVFRSLDEFMALGSPGSLTRGKTNAAGAITFQGLDPYAAYTVVPLYDANGNNRDDDGTFFDNSYLEVRTGAPGTTASVPTFTLAGKTDAAPPTFSYATPNATDSYAALRQAWGLTWDFDGIQDGSQRVPPMGVWVALYRRNGNLDNYFNWKTQQFDAPVGQVGADYFRRGAVEGQEWRVSLPALEPGSYTLIGFARDNARTIKRSDRIFTVASETARAWKGGAAGAEIDWMNPANWEPAGIPAPTDHVTIDGGGPLPVLTRTDTASPGPVSSLAIRNGGGLTLNGIPLEVTGNLEVSLNGTAGEGLRMTAATDTLRVGGDAAFHSAGTGTSEGLFTGGTLIVGGNFTAEGANAFASTGTAAQFAGTEPVSVRLDPAAPTGNRLYSAVANNRQGILLASDLPTARAATAGNADFLLRREALLKTLASKLLKILGSVRNGGVLSPGQSPGALTIEGDYAQDSTGVLQIEFGGPSSDPAGFDRLTVTGTAALGGTLFAAPLNGYAPAATDQYAFMTYGTHTGDFDTVAGAEGVTLGDSGATVAPLSGGGGGFERGDANRDSQVDVGDAVLVLRSIVGLAELTEEERALADMDASGGVDVGDAVAILRFVVGLPTQ